jgi:peptidoglycan/LPS O-acetylase OafA/YrhL
VPTLRERERNVAKSGIGGYAVRMSLKHRPLERITLDLPMGRRSQLLDLLRTIAVVLVLGRHLPLRFRVDQITNTWHLCGWVGVDLFFVLSGFLVSGLLFREYKTRGTFSVGRFLTRRGLKIYPAFYVFLVLSVGLLFATGQVVWKRAVVIEALFLQSYAEQLGGGRINGHTWSLAVEEHFYILLPLLLLALLRFGKTPDPFRLIPAIAIAVAAACLAMRCLNIGSTFDDDTHHFPTHLRIDSLMCGVALSYLFHFRPAFVAFATRLRWPILLAGIAIMSLAGIYDVTTPWLWTAGYLVFAIGSACLVTWAATGQTNSHTLRAIAWVGAYSYSIYLWHIHVLEWVAPYFSVSYPWLFIAAYVASCLAFGVLMSKLVEYPVLHLRDRWFPSRS